MKVGLAVHEAANPNVSYSCLEECERVICASTAA